MGDWFDLKSEKRRETTGQEEKITRALTSWAASEDQLTDFIIDKDEQGVREGAEPPVGPGKHTKTQKRR